MSDNPWAEEEDVTVTWLVPWPSSETKNQPPHRENFNRAVPPQSLDSLLRHCQQVSQEIWPDNDDNWSSGFDDLADITALLAQLLPSDSTLPPAVQFSATATAKAMNDALKLTRHSPASASSPLSRLLASKGSLEWEKSIKARQYIVPETSHVGWRVLEKEDRFGTVEDSKPRKAAGGLLSFWNRRASTIQAPPVETHSERPRSPTRSSLESAKSVPHPPSSRAASPSRASNPSVPLPPPTPSHPTTVTTAPAPSAVSRFLNRFARTKGAQHTALALSSDDLEFLSDIVPSAGDPPDDPLTGANNSSPLSPKLPPPIPPPPKQSIPSSRPSSALGLGISDDVSVNGSAPTTFQMQGTNHASHVPVLALPLSPKPAASFSHTQSPPSSLKDVTTPTIAFGQSKTQPAQQGLQPSSQPNSQLRSPSTLPLPRKIPPLLSTPPLLPPPPVSPPQTPRPSTFPSVTIPVHSSTMPITAFHDANDSDDEFSAFTSFPPASFPPADSYPSQRSPSPPSPPPRRTYERTHYPSSSSTSSILSPASQTSVDRLCSTTSSISAPLDTFDDFVSPPLAVRGDDRKRTPSPPPLPVKPQSQHRQPPRTDAFPSRVYHAHTPSQTTASPTVHTSLMNTAFSVPFVSDAEHQRTQSLVNHAAARGGMLWPDSPESNAASVRVIPPPPWSPTSPKFLIGEEDLDLLGDGDTLGGGVGMDSTVSSPAAAPFGPRSQLQPSPPPLAYTSTPILSFSSMDALVPSTAIQPGPLQPAKPKQTGGLSAQDLSFFEGL